jgi:hypothetical protein
MADAQGANTVQSLDGHFKQIYADRIQDLIPDGVKLLKRIDFVKAEKMAGGLKY